MHFFKVILLVEKSRSFPHTFIGVFSHVENSTLFPHTFFAVISMAENILLTFFNIMLMGKNSASFLVSCKLMKKFKKVFPVFIILNS